MKEIPIEEYFRYHPPATEARKKKHNGVNDLALKFAKYVDANIHDVDCKKMALFAIQQARMFANQGITVDEIKEKQCDT